MESSSEKVETATPRLSFRDYSVAFYGGAGIGLLVGVLMGLALSPVVGVIVGALSTMLAALLGLNDKHFGNAKSVRIGSFGFACVVGALCGVFIRVNSFLAPDIKSQYEAYTEVGYTGEEARSFIAYQRFGILDKEWQPAPGAKPGEGGESAAAEPSGATLAQMQSAVGLFSAETLGAA